MANTDWETENSAGDLVVMDQSFNSSPPTRKRTSEGDDEYDEIHDAENGPSGDAERSRQHQNKMFIARDKVDTPTKSYGNKKKLGISRNKLGNGCAIPTKDRKENLTDKKFTSATVKTPTFYGRDSSSEHISSSSSYAYNTYPNINKVKSLGMRGLSTLPNTIRRTPLTKNFKSSHLGSRTPQQKIPSLLSSPREAFSPKPVTPNQSTATRRLFGELDNKGSEKENTPIKSTMSNGSTFTPLQSRFNGNHFFNDITISPVKAAKLDVYKIGFKNYGNTCYLNSALQCLVGLKPFCNDVQAEMSITSTLLPHLRTLLRHLEQGDPHPVNLSVDNFRKNFVKVDRTFEGVKQQDSSEFLSKVLSSLSEDFSKANTACESALKENACVIEDNFEAKVAERYTCKSCEKVRDASQTHLLWYLPILEQGEDSKTVLSTQTLMEYMLGQHPAKCTNCGEEEGACTSKLTALPRILVLQLKRYDNQGDKVSTKVAISPFLDLDKYVDDKCQLPKACSFPLPNEGMPVKPEITDNMSEIEKAKLLSLQEQCLLDREEEEQMNEAMRQSLSGRLETSDDEYWDVDATRNFLSLPAKLKHGYRLVAMVNHIGVTATSGHYTASVWRSEVDRWFEYDDTIVRDISGGEIFGKVNQRNCYILFYMHRRVLEEVSAYEKNKSQTPAVTSSEMRLTESPD